MADIYVPGAIDIMGSANQMMQFRNAQQAQQENAMRMQYAAEDRARADEARKIAAGNALAQRAKAAKIAGVYEQGFNPGKTAVMGPGTVQGSTEPSYDYNKTALEFLKLGETGKAEELFKLPEARRTAGAEYMEKDAKARVEALKAETETYNTALARVKPVLDQAISIDGLMHYVDVVDADPVLGPLAVKTGGPTEARKEAIRKMAAPVAEGGGGMTVDQIAQRLGGIDGYALKTMDLDLQKKEAEIAKQNADAAKARAEAGGGGSGGTENERNRQLLARAMQDPEYVKTPEYAALFNMSFGPKMVEVQDPNGPPGQMINRVVNVPAPDVFPRPTFGQNTLAPAAQPTAAPTNALSMANRYGGAQAPMTAPPNLGVDMRTGEGMVTKQPAVSGEREKQAIAKETKIEGANTIINMDEDVTNLLNKATSGGLQKAGAETYAYLTGEGTSGMEADAQLKAISAKLLFANLPNGSLGGQVSDADRISIDKLSGDIANTDLPTNVRLSAWKKVVDIAKNTVDKKAPPAKTQQKVARSVDIEHTAKQNSMSVEDTKTRLRSMGFKIEGE
jgi:hypothetical protein